MTELEQQIQTLEAQIRVMTRAIATAKNSRRKAADVATLATLQGELDNLKTKNDAEPGTVEKVAGGEGEASDKTKQNEQTMLNRH